MSLLDFISSPTDLKKLPESKLPALCAEIRDFLLTTISRSGGHLASNLGTVELTVALHYVFDSPTDRLCWDVGHQTYVHKILTGRKDKLHTVRKFGGISGFPKISESEHDLYETGHAGTAISQAFGEAVARDLKLKRGELQNSYSCIAIVGDASIVTGMAFEAMNHAGYLKTPLLVVLNDNEMSISENVGAISYSLNRIITNRMYNKVSRRWFRWVRHLPWIGKMLDRSLHRLAAMMKGMAVDHQFFEELGFRYLGPIDGHDVNRLVNILRQLKEVNEPTILHTVTRKGKGYELAELDPIKYHGVTPFEKDKGLISGQNEKISLSKLVGAILSELAEKNQDIVVITPAMKEGSGLSEFAQRHPDNFFDTGIAEQHATTFAGALAKAGLTPFLCIYSTFLQRGFDQLVHDICLMNLSVRLVIDRAGCVGADGETHQGLYDIAFMAPLPHIVLFSAADAADLARLLIFMAKYKKGPISVRFPKRDMLSQELAQLRKKISLPKNYNPFLLETKQQGSDAVLFVEACMIDHALKTASLLKEKISLEVILVRCLKPLDIKGIANAIRGKKAVFTLENHGRRGGMGEMIAASLSSAAILKQPIEIFAYPDKPIEHGSVAEIEKKYLLDSQSIAQKILAVLSNC